MSRELTSRVRTPSEIEGHIRIRKLTPLLQNLIPAFRATQS